MTFLFRGCKSLTHVPAYNTMNVTNMAYMFSECTNLSNIPMMDLSNVTNLYSFINGCDLTNDSKENIMAMCINATNYAGTKSLTELGVSYEDAYNWEMLPGYTAFNAAGWSTM
jgi:surface protein